MGANTKVAQVESISQTNEKKKPGYLSLREKRHGETEWAGDS